MATDSSTAYGGGDIDCGGVVQAELTHLDANGTALGTTRFEAVLAVDVAVAPNGSSLSVVQAGVIDPDQPTTQRRAEHRIRVDGVPGRRYRHHGLGMQLPAAQLERFLVQAVAVAYASDKLVLVQTREPARSSSSTTPHARRRSISAATASTTPDTSCSIATPVRGIACASCHAEGADDGHVWRSPESARAARRT